MILKDVELRRKTLERHIQLIVQAVLLPNLHALDLRLPVICDQAVGLETIKSSYKPSTHVGKALPERAKSARKHRHIE